jgi:hypothetical protein
MFLAVPLPLEGDSITQASEQPQTCQTSSLHWDVPLRVRLLPYLGFSHWLDEALEELVDRWLDRVVPCARNAGS